MYRILCIPENCYIKIPFCSLDSHTEQGCTGLFITEKCANEWIEQLCKYRYYFTHLYDFSYNIQNGFGGDTRYSKEEFEIIEVEDV